MADLGPLFEDIERLSELKDEKDTTVFEPELNHGRTTTIGGIEIDLEDIVMVQAAEPDDPVYYHLFTEEHLESILREFSLEYNYDVAVDDVLTRIKVWKENGSGSSQAHIHEKACRNALGRHGSLRETLDPDDDVDPDSLTTAEEDVIKFLHVVSKKYLNHHHSDPVKVYRGFGYGLGKVAAQLFDRPEIDSLDVETSLVVNFTISKTIADEYGPLLFEYDVDHDHVLIAVDHLFAHKSVVGDATDNESGDEDTSYKWYTDGELQLEGPKMARIPRDKLYASGTSSSVPELINRIPDKRLVSKREIKDEHLFTDTDHQVLAALVDSIDNEDEDVYSQEGQIRIDNWFTYYVSHIEKETRNETESDLEAGSLAHVVKRLIEREPTTNAQRNKGYL